MLTDLSDGSITSVQVKATDSTSYVNDHIDRYPETEVYATTEVASNIAGVNSTGFSNDEITSEVATSIAELTEVIENLVSVSDAFDMGFTGTIIAGTVAGVSSYVKTKDPNIAVKEAASGAIKAFKNSAIFGLAASILF